MEISRAASAKRTAPGEAIRNMRAPEGAPAPINPAPRQGADEFLHLYRGLRARLRACAPANLQRTSGAFSI